MDVFFKVTIFRSRHALLTEAGRILPSCVHFIIDLISGSLSEFFLSRVQKSLTYSLRDLFQNRAVTFCAIPARLRSTGSRYSDRPEINENTFSGKRGFWKRYVF